MRRRLTARKLISLSSAVIIWVVLASSLAYSLDLECFLDDDACRQVCVESTEDLCGEPLHLGPPSYLPTPFFQLLISLTVSPRLSIVEVSQELVPRATGHMPVGLRAPPPVC
jgi:hypothetical protein